MVEGEGTEQQRYCSAVIDATTVATNDEAIGTAYDAAVATYGAVAHRHGATVRDTATVADCRVTVNGAVANINDTATVRDAATAAVAECHVTADGTVAHCQVCAVRVIDASAVSSSKVTANSAVANINGATVIDTATESVYRVTTDGAVADIRWILLGVGAVLVFLSGGIILRATSLWEFFIAFVALAGGFQLMTSGSIRF